MLDIFNYSFMIRAFIAGTIIAVIAPFIGVFLVSRKYALIADSLAHVSLAGIALGLLMGIHPIITALIVTMSAAVLIERLRSDHRLSGESVLAIFLSGGLAVSVVLISLANGFNTNLFSYLFGSITTVAEMDLWIIGVLGAVVLLTLCLLYKELMYSSFDRESAAVSGVPVTFINRVLVILTAITVVLSLRIVGALLIGALMVIPVVTATQMAKSFKQTVLFAMGISLLSVILGLFMGYYLNLPAGGAIVLVSLLFFGISLTKTRSGI